MDLSKDEITVVLRLLGQISLPVEQTEKILLPIMAKLRAKIAEETS